MRSNSQFNVPLKYDEATAEAKSRLLARRKKYSQTKVPTVQLDDSTKSRTSTNVYRKESTRLNRNLSNTSSSLSPTQFTGSAGSSSLSIDPSDRLHSGIIQRAFSASPSKNSPSNSCENTAQPLVSASSLDGVSMRNSTHSTSALRVPMLYQRHSFKSPPQSPPLRNAMTSAPLTGRWLKTATSEDPTRSATSLMQQRSVESHESSVSMPSACSSGSGSVFWCRKGIARLSFKKHQPSTFEDEPANKNMVPVSPAGVYTTHRRSSYEMATGKLKIPEPKIKRSPLKNALHALKDKVSSMCILT
ncbi:unnamed protein product [Dicrocoelium dendriticum]|nr:unnamed protein product [Dicrocoelium dendriticum]